MKSRVPLAGAAAACLTLPLVGVGPALAGHDDGPRAAAGGVEVVASGLANPRGLAVLDGDVYVAQAGSGRAAGDPERCFIGAEEMRVCLGATGKISRLDVDDDGTAKVTDVVTGLASLAGEGGAQAVGPTDVTVDGNDRLHAVIGLGGNPEAAKALGAEAPADQLATAGLVDRHDGTYDAYADVGAFEVAHNPDGNVPFDTNPYAIAASRGVRVVADAGGNTLLRVKRNGDVSTLAVFPDEASVQVPGAPPGTMIEPQAVPNAVVRGPDGAFYVGQLTGFPFVPGTATVWRVTPGKDPKVYADGFTNIIDLAFTREGNLLVLEIAKDGLLATPPGALPTGALIEVSRKDTDDREVLTEDLAAPGGVAVDGSTAYITNKAVTPDAGEVLRLDLGD
ncbi:ScyD/ScyE family protein [Georgenia sp. SYP-B2076]|uniref:ScyD/ScyE family protein n=1 Tax=Georgenia sp. SYP-B2076 TaxID=2495881 RepID=UPI000F8D062A|nr:ScyD/ScyE family protein [Georgenia sp. SYP-B2076]